MVPTPYLRLAALLALCLWPLVGQSASLINLSSRAPTSPGANTLTVGFAVGGTGSKPVLARGIGPALTGFGVPGAIANPVLSIFDSRSAPLINNAGWGGNTTLSAAFTRTGAFALPTSSTDAALLTSLQPGSYTAQISDSANGSGVALAEIYDADTSANPTARLVNLSARAFVGAGTANALTAGFVIAGAGTTQVLIRGIGPTLGQFGLAGSLSTPVLTVFDSAARVIATNTAWGGSAALSTAFAQVGAFALSPTSRDCAMLLTLPAGAYSAQVSGAGDTTGVALVEVYEVSPPLPLQTQITNFLTLNQANPGPLVLPLASGTYTSATTAINLTNVSFPKGLVIDGTGVKIVMTNFVNGITLTNTTGVTISNLTIDYDPLPFTQGTVSQVTTNAGGATTSALLTLDAGAQWAPPPAASSSAPIGRVWAVDATGNLAYNTPTYYLTAITPQASRQYLLSWQFPTVDGLRVGHKLVIPLTVGGIRAAWLRTCTDCGFDNVRIYASPDIAVFDQFSTGSRYNKVSVIPRSNSGNIASCNADGIHVQNCANGPTITNCTVTHAGDDGIVTHTLLGLVMGAATDTNTIRIATKFSAVPWFFPGDTLGFFPGAGTGAYFTAVVGTIAQNPNVTPPAGFDFISDITLAAGQRVNVDASTWVNDITRAAPGFVIQDNVVANTRARGIFARGINGKIVNNQISYIAMAGIGSMAFANTPFEGDFNQNLLIQGNTLSDINYSPISGDNLAGAISVTVGLQLPGSTEAGAFSWGSKSGHTNTTIIGNTIRKSRGPYVHLHGGNKWEISGNFFHNPQTLSAPVQNRFDRLDENCVVWLSSVDAVAFGTRGANTVIQRGPTTSPIVSQGTNVTNVTGAGTFINQ